MIVRARTIKFAADRTPDMRQIRLGFEGDNLVERLEFMLPVIAQSQTATLMMGGKYANAVTLEADENGRYCVELTKEIVGTDGEIEAYIRIDGSGGEVWHSGVMRLTTRGVPDVETQVEQRFPSAVEIMLKEIAKHNAQMDDQTEAVGDLVADANEAARIAADGASAANELAGAAAESAGRSAKSASTAKAASELATNQAISAANSATNAANSANAAAQSANAAEASAVRAEEAARREVDKWLDDHPEVTTAVQDKSLGIDKFTDAAKTYILNDCVTPEMFGAVGDGIADDTEAVRSAMGQNKPVLLRGAYAISESITVQTSNVIGCNSTIKLTKNAVTVFEVPSVFSIEGVTFDCGDHGVRWCLVSEANNHFYAKNVSVRNIKNYGFAYQGGLLTDSCGIRVVGGHVTMDSVEAHHIYALSNGKAGDGNGAAYGVHVAGYDFCSINNSVFSNCHTMDEAGNVVWEDGGSIYCASGRLDTVCRISNLRITDPGKYGIKVQDSNVRISGVFLSNSMDDFGAGIVVLPAGGNTDEIQDTNAALTGCQLFDTRTEFGGYTGAQSGYGYLIHVQNRDVCITDCVLDTRAIFALACDSSAHARGSVRMINCTVHGKSLYGAGMLFHATGCVFDGHCLINQYSSDAELRFTDCTMTISDYGKSANVTDAGYCISNGHVTFDGCELRVVGVSGLRTHGTALYEYRGCKIVVLQNDNANAGLLQINEGATMRLTDCTIDGGDNLAGYWLIYCYGNLELDNCRDDNCALLRFRGTGGRAHVRNMQIPRFDVDADGAYQFGNSPYYTDALPTRKTPDGALVLLTSDGKLYRRVGGVWSAAV